MDADKDLSKSESHSTGTVEEREPPRSLDDEISEMEARGFIHIPALLRKVAKFHDK